MADNIEVPFDEDLAQLVGGGGLSASEAIQLQTLREVQSISDTKNDSKKNKPVIVATVRNR